MDELFLLLLSVSVGDIRGLDIFLKIVHKSILTKFNIVNVFKVFAFYYHKMILITWS